MKNLKNLFAIISVIIIASFVLVSCNQDETNEDYLLVVPEVANFNGPTVVFIGETHRYSVTPLRGGSEYIWVVDGAETSNVPGRPDLLDVTFNQIDVLAHISVKEKAANGKESEVSLKEIKIFDTPCDWTIEMQDAYGDGWNGGSVSFSFDGYPAGDYFIENVSGDELNDLELTAAIPVPNNSDVQVTFNSGDWDSEITYQIYDASGNLVFSDGPTPIVGISFEAHNDCP